MGTSRHSDNHIFDGDVALIGTLSALPAGSLTNAMVSASADIVHTKVEHRFPVTYRQTAGTAVAAETQEVYSAYFTGTVVDIRGVCSTAPTGGDLAFTVDVQKSTGAGAFATILSSTETFNSSSVDRTSQDFTLSGTPTLAANDTLQVIVAVSGSTGTQGAGLVVTITVAENSNA